MLWVMFLLVAWGAAAITCVRLCLASAEAAQPPTGSAPEPVHHELNLYETAFLAGGPHRVADLALVSMHLRRLLPAHTGWATVVDPEGRDEVERTVIRAIGPEGQSPIAPIRAAAAAADAVRALADPAGRGGPGRAAQDEDGHRVGGAGGARFGGARGGDGYGRRRTGPGPGTGVQGPRAGLVRAAARADPGLSRHRPDREPPVQPVGLSRRSAVAGLAARTGAGAGSRTAGGGGGAGSPRGAGPGAAGRPDGPSYGRPSRARGYRWLSPVPGTPQAGACGEPGAEPGVAGRRAAHTVPVPVV
ncbi:hypothetical protein ACVWXU_002631 [Streptomyces sp. TE33382]